MSDWCYQFVSRFVGLKYLGNVDFCHALRAYGEKRDVFHNMYVPIGKTTGNVIKNCIITLDYKHHC